MLTAGNVKLCYPRAVLGLLNYTIKKEKKNMGRKSVAKILEKLEVILHCVRAMQAVICLSVKLVQGCLPILGTQPA